MCLNVFIKHPFPFQTLILLSPFPNKGKLHAADCGLLELESWKPQELLCGCMIKAQEFLCGRMFEPQELLCGSLRWHLIWKEWDRYTGHTSENAKYHISSFQSLRKFIDKLPCLWHLLDLKLPKNCNSHLKSLFFYKARSVFRQVSASHLRMFIV